MENQRKAVFKTRIYRGLSCDGDKLIWRLYVSMGSKKLFETKNHDIMIYALTPVKADNRINKCGIEVTYF